MAASTSPLHTCELCGQEGLQDQEMRSHMLLEHVEGSPACPFCSLGELSSSEMELHVNTAHLDFLTPESDSLQYLEAGGEEYGSLWRLDLCAGGEGGLAGGGGGSPGAVCPFVESEEEDTDCDTTVCSVVPGRGERPKAPARPGSASPLPGSPRKRLRSGGTEPDQAGSGPGSPRREVLSLPLRRPTGGCSPGALQAREPATLPCPLCPHTDTDAARLQEHVNRQHLDQLSPAPQQLQTCPLCPATFPNPTLLQDHFSSAHPDLSPALSPGSPVCPVCGEKGWSEQQLQVHVESHFASGSRQEPAGGEAAARELEVAERAKRKREEAAEFASLQAQYGMDGQGNFTQQSASGLRRAVVAGQLSVVDFYERSAGLAESHRSGEDDGASRTPKITSILRGLSQAGQGVVETLLASRTDHYASTFGDKGWGCGFRNLQMLLSCLLHSTQHRDAVLGGMMGNRNLAGAGRGAGPGLPSIPRLQAVIEEAWRAGFDRAGCEQLGGRLVNTRKWIGATEVATLLSYCNVASEIYDFHAPSAPDGSHPRLFDWVVTYFRRPRPLTPPLYLQHQGHSRTVVGAEVMAGGAVKLLILDPSHSPASLGEHTMRLVRKTVGSMRSKQYQLVAVTGTLHSAAEREAKKVVVSRRVPE